MPPTDRTAFPGSEQPLILAAVLFFAGIAVMFTTPVGEGDFFWHVKTGEWIWQHKALPDYDPFSFTVKDVNPFNPGSKRIPFLLKQYWLGQLGFYHLWRVAGEAGMVIFRSVCYTGILLFLYGWSRRRGEGIAPLLAVIATGNVLLNYSNERPQIFAFILMPLLLVLLERIRARGASGPDGVSLVSLPLVMVVWSNCHGSFILGVVVIALYGAACLVDRIRLGERVNSGSLVLMASAALVTGANPNGFGAFREFFSLSSGYTDLVAEFKSPILLATEFHVIDYYYWITLLATAATVISALRRTATHHLLVITALAALSLTATRYIPFFMLALPLLSGYLPRWRPSGVLRLAPLLVVILLLGTADYRNILKFRAERGFPVKAAEFLREAGPRGNMFNYIGWGGYLMCYSRYPVFVDGRTLIEDYLPIHNSILAGINWRETLEQYGINFMIIPGTDAITLQAYPLLLQLLGDNDWSLVYLDDTALVLVRNIAEHREIVERYAKDKGLISSHIQARWRWQTVNDF